MVYLSECVTVTFNKLNFTRNFVLEYGIFVLSYTTVFSDTNSWYQDNAGIYGAIYNSDVMSNTSVIS